MKSAGPLGQFEHLLLLAILRLGDEAHGLRVRRELEERAGRKVSRGALYTTLERLGDKGFIEWRTDDAPPSRGGVPRRRYRVTETGVAAVRDAQQAISSLAEGIEEVLS